MNHDVLKSGVCKNMNNQRKVLLLEVPSLYKFSIIEKVEKMENFYKVYRSLYIKNAHIPILPSILVYSL